MESVLQVLERPIPPEQIAGLDALGIDLSKPLLPAYSVETHAALIDFVVRQRWPELPPEEGQFEAGRAFIDIYTQTQMGRAIKGLVKTIGPHRALERMNRTFRTANNFTETRLLQLGPATFELWFNFVSRPGYYRGLVYQTLFHSGVPELEVTQSSRQGDEVTYRVVWRP